MNEKRRDVTAIGPEFSSNQDRFPAEEFTPNAGQHIGWSRDGRHILAQGNTPGMVLCRLIESGVDSDQVVLDYVDGPGEDLAELLGVASRRPMVSITLAGPRRAINAQALVSTGTAGILFHDSLATVLGLDLTNAPRSTMFAGMEMVPVRSAEVELHFHDGREVRVWHAQVGFTDLPLQRPRLGMTGFLQYFTTSFYQGNVEFAVNGPFQGK